MAYYFIFMAIMIFILMAVNCKESKKYDPEKDQYYTQIPHNRGTITKFEFEGHSYVGWSCNFGAGLVHDPDCKCKKSATFQSDLNEILK